MNRARRPMPSPTRALCLLFIAYLAVGILMTLWLRRERMGRVSPGGPPATLKGTQNARLWVKLTAYCPGPCKICKTRGLTRLDTIPVPNKTVAMEKRYLGCRVRILSYRGTFLSGASRDRRMGWKRVEDTGVTGRRLDYCLTHREAMRIDPQWVLLEISRPQKGGMDAHAHAKKR